MKVTVKGLPELKAKLGKLSAEMKGDATRRATLAGAQVFEGGIKMNIQRQGLIDTGAMIGSVEAKNTSNTEAVVGPSSEYAIYHEYGTGIYGTRGGRQTPWVYFNDRVGHFVRTRGMPASPFVRPAFDQKKGDALEAAVDVLKRAVNSV